jgi:hypothetical protein
LNFKVVIGLGLFKLETSASGDFRSRFLPKFPV